MGDIKIKITVDDRLAVESPYNEDFVTGAHYLSGEFIKPYWLFDLRNELAVRNLLKQVYGHDGSGTTETVEVEIDLDAYEHLYDRVIFAGLTIAIRPGRDHRVRLGHGAIVKKGGFDATGGSVKNPRLDAHEGTVLLLRDVPAGHSDLRCAGVTVVGRDIDVEGLKSERARLQARIDEIDNLLDEV